LPDIAKQSRQQRAMNRGVIDLGVGSVLQHRRS
jgi:hypothetical protein